MVTRHCTLWEKFNNIPKYLWVLPLWTFICLKQSSKILSYSVLSQAIVLSITEED